MPAKRPQVSASQVRLPCSQRACQEGEGYNITSPPCSSYGHNFHCLHLLHRISAVQLLNLASLNCYVVPHLELGLDSLVGGLLLGGTSPCSIELALATWCHSNKYITCIPLYHPVKFPQFSDTSLKITTSVCSCGAPVL